MKKIRQNLEFLSPEGLDIRVVPRSNQKQTAAKGPGVDKKMAETLTLGKPIFFLNHTTLRLVIVYFHPFSSCVLRYHHQ